MKIGSVDTKPVANPAPAERRPNAAPAVSGVSALGASSTQVDLSATAVGLASPGSDPAFDTAKVERIAQAIRDGKFTVNAEAIADKLLLNAEELLGRRLSS
ncbi:MAG TPA: flagellar biosynthesis anti-sigma factor FlgM [Rubrivivax sp.]|nr:flagellar biosynthesis anti-sigma factor FlgM [Rubrivivax sp.]